MPSPKVQLVTQIPRTLWVLECFTSLISCLTPAGAKFSCSAQISSRSVLASFLPCFYFNLLPIRLLLVSLTVNSQQYSDNLIRPRIRGASGEAPVLDIQHLPGNGDRAGDRLRAGELETTPAAASLGQGPTALRGWSGVLGHGQGGEVRGRHWGGAGDSHTCECPEGPGSSTTSHIGTGNLCLRFSPGVPSVTLRAAQAPSRSTQLCRRVMAAWRRASALASCRCAAQRQGRDANSCM